MGVPRGRCARVCTCKSTCLYNFAQAVLYLTVCVVWPLQPGFPGLLGNTTCLASFPGNWLFFTVISFPSSPHKILPLMMDATPLQGGREERKKAQRKKKQLVKFGKPHGFITWEEKPSAVAGLLSSVAQAVYCPSPGSDILMDYHQIGTPLSWAVQGKGPA